MFAAHLLSISTCNSSHSTGPGFSCNTPTTTDAYPFRHHRLQSTRRPEPPKSPFPVSHLVLQETAHGESSTLLEPCTPVRTPSRTNVRLHTLFPSKVPTTLQKPVHQHLRLLLHELLPSSQCSVHCDRQHVPRQPHDCLLSISVLVSSAPAPRTSTPPVLSHLQSKVFLIGGLSIIFSLERAPTLASNSLRALLRPMGFPIWAVPLQLAMLHRMVFGVLSRSSEYIRSVFLVLVRRTVRFCVVDKKLFALASVQLAYHRHWIPARRVPLVPGCAVGDVDRREVVKKKASIFCPFMNFLRLSALFVILPSEHDGRVFVLSRSSVGVFRFPMVFLPSSFAVSFTSRVTHSCKVARNDHSLKSGLDSLLFSSSGRRQMPQEQKFNPSGTGLKQDWHWTVLDVCPSSWNSTFPSS